MHHSNGQDRQAEVTVAEWERRKEFVGFTDDDVRVLRDLRPISEAYVDEVVEELYRQFLRFDETRAFFPDDATLNRVKAFQKEYFLGLTAGDYGQAYLANRLHIGRVHQRIRLSPRWYMGAYSIYMQSVIPRILAAYGADREKAQRTVLALLKIIRGIVGLNAPNPVVTHHRWQPSYMLVLQSDGLTTRWRWTDFPDLGSAAASVIARRLLLALAKDEDDATVLVVKERDKTRWALTPCYNDLNWRRKPSARCRVS